MLTKIDKAVSKIEDIFSVVLFLAMVLITCWSVLCRYVLKVAFLQGEEISRYLMIYVVYLGTSVAVKTKQHIGVDVFVEMLPAKLKSNVKIFTEILCAAIFVLLFVLSIQMIGQQISTHQMTTTTQIPMYVVSLCIPIGLLFGIIHCITGISGMILDKMSGKGEQA